MTPEPITQLVFGCWYGIELRSGCLGIFQNGKVEEAEEEVKSRAKGSGGGGQNSDLFVPIPPTADCVICMVPLPICESDTIYATCCGKKVCGACADGHEAAHEEVNADRKTKKQPPLPLSCEFCRAPSNVPKEKTLKRFEKRIEIGDAEAVMALAAWYTGQGRKKGVRSYPRRSSSFCGLLNLVFRKHSIS